MVRRMAEKISFSAERISLMMSELVDALIFNNGDRLPLKLSEFSIADLIQDVSVQYLESERGKLQVCSEEVRGHWCYDMIRRALENLVNNAISYGDGKIIDIDAKQERGRLMLSVHNTGNPIAKSELGNLFDFGAKEGASHATGGWGIGLAFVKRVAQSHGGSISIDSSPEAGTTFLIDIPVDCRPYVVTHQNSI